MINHVCNPDRHCKPHAPTSLLSLLRMASLVSLVRQVKARCDRHAGGKMARGDRTPRGFPRRVATEDSLTNVNPTEAPPAWHYITPTHHHSDGPTVEIFIKDTNETFSVTGTIQSTARELLATLCQRSGLNPRERYLTFAGKTFSKKLTLEQQGITQRSTISLHQRYAGGMTPQPERKRQAQSDACSVSTVVWVLCIEASRTRLQPHHQKT